MGRKTAEKELNGLMFNEFLNFLIDGFIDKYYNRRDRIEIKIQLDDVNGIVKLLLVADDDIIGTLNEFSYEEALLSGNCKTLCVMATCVYLTAMDFLYGEDENPLRKSSLPADLGLADKIIDMIEQLTVL